jgi:NAD(P)H-nitrite reductase large subunit
MAEQHVIIGGGPAATNAIETIRQVDGGKSQITLISDEPAHSRMALPYWLAGQIPREHTMTADDAYFAKLKVEARVGVRAQKIDTKGKSVTLSDGKSVKFDNLLIATGSRPAELPVAGADLPGVGPLWTIENTQCVLDAAKENKKPRVLMIGSGFIGFIMLNAMHKRGWQLTVVEMEKHVLPRMLDDQAAAIAETWLRGQGVDLHCGTTVKRITEKGKARVAELADGTSVETDLVIIATGVKPNVELAVESGIDADQNGISVNNRLQTSAPNVYAAGDVAVGPVLHSTERAVHAIQPTAVDHGRIAGSNMAGRQVDYPGSLSMNILDVCGLQNASFGDWSDTSAEAMTISNPGGYIYRNLLWNGDKLSGAVFVGRANDMGMLTDVGMVKGIMQTGTSFGSWKQFLQENPFDIRRPYVALKVAQKLTGATLLGTPSRTRGFQYQNMKSGPAVKASHAVFMETSKG